jgi:uncharacterized OsmC-like protein
VLVIRRIRVGYRLRGCPPEKREAAQRAHAAHATRCPVHRTIAGCVEITTSLEFV